MAVRAVVNGEEVSILSKEYKDWKANKDKASKKIAVIKECSVCGEEFKVPYFYKHQKNCKK